MGLILRLVVGALSFAPAFVGEGAGASLAGCSRLALAALPWLAAIGLPARASRSDPPNAAVFELSLALPALGLGAWLDLRAGFAPSELALSASGALLLCVLLARARSVAARSGGPTYGIAWLALVPGAPALAFALSGGWTPAVQLARFSPLAWMWERARLPAEAGWRALWTAPVPAALGLLVLALLLAGPARGRAA